MNNITTTPTADLIAELMELEKNAKSKPVSLECVYARQVKANRHSEICYELDRRCEDAQIAIIDGVFCFHPHPFLGEGKFAKWRWIQHVLGIKKRLLASELRDLLTWLLMKGGNG